MIFIRTLLITGIFCSIFLSCSKNSSNTGGGGGGGGTTTINCTGVTPGFVANVKPLIQASCAISSGCHSTGSMNSGGPLTTYTEIKNKASVIRSQVVSKAMPQGGTLTAAQIQTIACWVDNGAPNN